MRLLTPLAFALALVSVTLDAGAQPAAAKTTKPDDQSASAKFKKAQAAYEAKDFAAALELARAAVDATGSPNARLYVARCLRELGRVAEAHAEMEQTLRDAREQAVNDEKYTPTRDAAAAELALLDQRVGKVVVALVDAPPDARVEINGQPLENTRRGLPVAVTPGDVLVRASAEGAAAVEKQTRIAAGQTHTITLVFRDAAQETETPPQPAPPPPAPRKSGGGLRTVGYVTAGVGVLSLGVFAVTGAMASSKLSQLDDECGGARCTDPRYADTVDSGKRLETISNVSLIVGSVGVLAGGAMILFGGPSAERGGSASVSASPAGASFNYLRRF